MPTPVQPSAPVAPPDPFTVEVRRRVARRTPAALLLLAGITLVSALLEGLTFPSRLPAILTTASLLMAWIAVAVSWVRRQPQRSVALMVVCVNLATLLLAAYYAWHDASAEWCLLLFTALLATVTMILPWGWSAQLAACTGAGVGYPLALWGGAEAVLPPLSGIFFLANVIGMTTLGAALLQRYARSDFLLTRELRDREARLRSYLEQALMGIAVVTPDLAWLEVNDELIRIVGYDRGDLGERKWTDLSHRDDLPAERAELGRIERGESDGYSLARRVIRKSGEVRHVLVSTRCIRGGGRRALRLVLMVQDITQLKITELELRRAKEVAEEADRSKTDFLARMSHELRTPMNVIFGMTEMALDSRPSEQQRDYLLRTQFAAQKLLVLVDDVLDFSKLEVGGVELEAKAFELRPWLERTMASLASSAHDKGVELCSEVSPDVPGSLLGDPERLTQIVGKLVGNAIKFTEGGRITVLAERMATGAGPPVIHFSVRDTGIGIPPEHRERIFTAFVQASPSSEDRLGGAGLGLTICARLVDRMGGRIWVESEVGKGSCFHFTAPVAPEGAPPSAR